MELSEQLLKELQSLQGLYKTNFDLVSQKVTNQAEMLQTAVTDFEQATERTNQLSELLKDVIAEKDVQVMRLIKITAALTVVTDQITARFQTQS